MKLNTVPDVGRSNEQARAISNNSDVDLDVVRLGVGGERGQWEEAYCQGWV